MAERMLTQRELNRATLSRQMLLDRASVTPVDAIAHLVGLQAQIPNPPYIGLWTRLQSFQRSELTQMLENRQVVRATMMRSTLHLMTAEDYVLMRLALQPALTRALYAFFGKPAKSIDIEQVVTAAQTYIQEQPRTFAQIRSRLMELFPNIDPALLAYVVRTHLPLVQMPPGGTWGFGGNPMHIEASTWLGRSLADAEAGQRLLILRYLAAFGPATVRDMQTWSGLVQLKSAVEALKPELSIFRDEQGKELFDLPDSALPPVDTFAPPRFLPEFDNLILSHADRSRFVPEQYRISIFLPAGRVRATFLIDGIVAGMWKIEKANGVDGVTRLVIEPFEPLSKDQRDALVEEAERLVRFIEDKATRVDIENV